MKKILILSAISALFILSCHKTKPTSCTTDVASIAGSYKITAATYKASSSSPETDIFNILFDACERDDIYTFQTNGNYQLKDAGVVCSPSGDSFGTWSLSGNTMVIDGDPTSVNSFDCHTLVIVNTDTQVAGDQLKLTLTKQ